MTRQWCLKFVSQQTCGHSSLEALCIGLSIGDPELTQLQQFVSQLQINWNSHFSGLKAVSVSKAVAKPPLNHDTPT